MERIQEAIAKARAERSTAGPGQAPHARTAPESGADSSPANDAGPSPDQDAAWALLAPLTLSDAHLARQRIVTVTGGREATYFDAMRTKVIQQIRTNGWQRLAITSPTAACGKSTIALNLAFSLARQPNLRVIVVELDFRRPSMAKTLGFTPKANFSQVLEGTSAFGDVAMRHGYNLALATNSRPVRDAAELLQNPRTAKQIAQIEAEFAPDLMIFDMPPMLVTDDAMAFASQVDCMLLVAAAEATSIKEIDTCEREIAGQTNVMGVILNKCRYMGPEYGYGYYG